MDNLKLPAYPIPEKDYQQFSEKMPDWAGFNKLEMASLMIAPGLIQAAGIEYFDPYTLAKTSVQFAKAVLEEANK